MNSEIKSFARATLAAGAIMLFPAAALADDFSGPYGGVEAGYVITDVDGVTIAGPFERTEHSAVISAVVGYRMPLGQGSPVVLGAEGSAGTYTSRADERYSVSGTLGYRIADRGLIYGRVGYGWLDGVDSNAGDGIDGLILGGGYEHKLTESVSMRAEYRHIDWRGGPDFPDNVVHFEGHEIGAALLYNF